jgi:hypothetical protein
MLSSVASRVRIIVWSGTKFSARRVVQTSVFGVFQIDLLFAFHKPFCCKLTRSMSDLFLSFPVRPLCSVKSQVNDVFDGKMILAHIALASQNALPVAEIQNSKNSPTTKSKHYKMATISFSVGLKRLR